MDLAHDGGGRRDDGELGGREVLPGESTDRGSGTEAARCGELGGESGAAEVVEAAQVPDVKMGQSIAVLHEDLNEDV